MINTPEGFDARNYPTIQRSSIGILKRQAIKLNQILNALKLSQLRVMDLKQPWGHKYLVKEEGIIFNFLSTEDS